MRSPTVYLGVALGALWLVRPVLADDPAPSSDSLAKMPANPVTSPTPPSEDTSAAPTASRLHGHDQQAPHADAASTAPPTGSPGAATGAAAPLPEPPATPKKVCRNMDVSGSKIPKRVCATPDEWATFENRAREDTQAGLRRLRDQGAIAPPSPGVSASQLPPTH